MGRHLATFTRRPGSSLYTLTTASPPVTASGQVAASSQVFAAASRSSPAYAPCSCRPLSHETLLWHHRLGHPSLPRLRGMASRTLVSGLLRSLPPLPPGPAPTCVPCVEGRGRAAPHSSTFPPTEAPLQTLHMDVWGPARVRGQGHERYFLLVVDDYSRYTTVFPLRSKGEVTEVLIDWIRSLLRSLPPLPPGPAPTCVPCVEGRGRAAPHSSTFPPTEAPLQTLHMDVWGPARVRGQGHERYFLLVVDDYSRYTTVFPLRSKGEVTEVLIDWIRGTCRQGSDWIARCGLQQGDTTLKVDLMRSILNRERPQKMGSSRMDHGRTSDVHDHANAALSNPIFLWGGRKRERLADALCTTKGPQKPASPLLGPSPYSGLTRGLTERREPESCPASLESRSASLVCTVRTGRRVSRPPLVAGTHSMTLRPSTTPQRVPLPSPPASSLPDGLEPESDSLRAASPAVTRFLAIGVTHHLFESTAASTLVAELVDFVADCRLDYATSLVAESASAFVCTASVGGECALGRDVLEDRHEEFECFVTASPHLVSMLLSPEGDPDAPDIPTPRSYAEAIEGPYSSQWQAAMDAEMASWKSTGTYVNEVPPPGANITFSPTPKMTTLRVLLHVTTQRDYELRSLDFSIAFLQGSLHEEIWLRCPSGFTGRFPAGTQWSLQQPVYGLRQVPREWHDTLRMTLPALGFAPSTADPLLFLRTNTTLPPFYVLVYVDDLVFATADAEALAHMKSELQKRHTCTDLGELTSYLGLRITRDRAQRTITLTQSHMVQQVLQRFGFTYSSPQSTPLPTGHSLSAPPLDESVEPSGPYPELVGCLMYLMNCTRPDLAYPLSLLARYVAPGRHRKVQWDVAKRVLRYMCSPSAPWPIYLAATATAAAATAAAATAAPAAPTYCDTMASLRVLAFDHEGRPVKFDTWLDDLHLYLLRDSKDSVSLFDLASGAATAPPATDDSATRSQWLTRDAAARLAIHNHLPLAKCTHFGQHKTPQALYDAVVARYSSPTTTALGRLLLPYLFLELSAFAIVEDLVSHLCASDTRYRAAAPAELLDKNQPPMFITLYFIVTRLPDSLRSVRDHFLSLDPTSLTVDLLEQHLLAAQTSAVAVGTARGTPRPPFFEGCSPSPLAPSYAFAAAAAADVFVGEDVGAAFAGAKRRSSKGKGGTGGGGGSDGGGGGSGSSGGGSSGGGGGGGSGGSGGGGTGARRGVFGGGQRQQQQRRSETQYRVAIFDLDFDAILSAMYALSVSAEGDCYRCVPPDPGIAAAALGASESSTLPGTAPAEALHTFTLDSGASRCFFRDSTTLTPLPAPVPVRLADPSGGPVVACSSTVFPCPAVPSGSQSGSILYTLATEPSQVAASAQVSASGQVPPPCSCRLLSHQTLLWHHHLGHPSLPRLRGMHSHLLVSGLPKSLPPLPPSRALLCLPCVEGRQRAAPHSSSFPPMAAPLQTLHMDSFTIVDSPQQNRIAERRIGLVMEVARTSMIHAAAPHFVWPFAIQYAAHQLNLLPRVSLPETSPTLRWTGKIGDVSVFQVWGSRAFVRDPSAEKLYASAIPCVFLGFVFNAPGWQFYHPTSCRVLPSQDVTFDESVPYYRLFPYRSTPLPPPPLFLAQDLPPVDPLPPQGPAPSGVSQVDPPPGVVLGEVAVDLGAARGTASGGAELGGAGPGGAELGGAETGGAEPGGVETWGTEPRGAEPEGVELGGAASEGAGSRGAKGAGAGGAGVAAGAGVTGGTAATGAGARDPTESGAAGTGGSGAGGAGAGGAGVGGTCAEGAGVRGTGAGGAGAGGAGPWCRCADATVPHPESDRDRAANPTLSCLLATTVTDASFESTTVSAFVAELLDFAAACRLDYASVLVAESASPSPPSVGGEGALCMDVLEDMQEDLECLAAAVPCFASMLLAPEGDPDAPNIPTPLSYAEAITGPYSSLWQAAMDAKMAS
ncbi:unnamed protein product [Closterium sp. NIES-54]